MAQNPCEINTRFTFVMHKEFYKDLQGIAHEVVNLFCNLMELCTGIGNSKYYAILEKIQIASYLVFDYFLKFAATQERTINKESGKPLDEQIVLDGGTRKK